MGLLLLRRLLNLEVKLGMNLLALKESLDNVQNGNFLIGCLLLILKDGRIGDKVRFKDFDPQHFLILHVEILLQAL
jgi:hypothetical protein